MLAGGPCDYRKRGRVRLLVRSFGVHVRPQRRATRRVRVEPRPAARHPDPSGPFAVQICTVPLTVMAQLTGDRRDRLTSIAERVRAHIMLQCEHETVTMAWMHIVAADPRPDHCCDRPGANVLACPPLGCAGTLGPRAMPAIRSPPAHPSARPGSRRNLRVRSHHPTRWAGSVDFCS